MRLDAMFFINSTLRNRGPQANPRATVTLEQTLAQPSRNRDGEYQLE
jgi:hypothetical protein